MDTYRSMLCLLFLFLGSRIPAPAAKKAVVTTLYTFSNTNYAPGYGAYGSVSISNHILYGTTQQGGTGTQCYAEQSGCGTVFSLTPPSSPGGAWTESVLWNFGVQATDGANPVSGTVIAEDGTIYGTTYGGGIGPLGGYGTVFSLTPPATPGGSCTEAVIWSFGANGADGIYPIGRLVLGLDGVLYGVAGSGGTYGAGIVFSLTPPAAAGGAWTERVLWNFGGAPWLGSGPSTGVVLNEEGVLFGGTSGGGHYQEGTVYALSRDKGVWSATIMYEPAYPEGYPTAVELGPGGVVYFATGGAGTRSGGSLTAMTPPASPGGTWTVTGIYDFPSHRHYAGNGAGPNGLRVKKETGILYGTAASGGGGRAGTLFDSVPPASAGGRWEFHRLFDFGYVDGYDPNSGFAEDSDGVLYGVTSNTVFSLIP